MVKLNKKVDKNIWYGHILAAGGTLLCTAILLDWRSLNAGEGRSLLLDKRDSTISSFQSVGEKKRKPLPALRVFPVDLISCHGV